MYVHSKSLILYSYAPKNKIISKIIFNIIILIKFCFVSIILFASFHVDKISNSFQLPFCFEVWCLGHPSSDFMLIFLNYFIGIFSFNKFMYALIVRIIKIRGILHT